VIDDVGGFEVPVLELMGDLLCVVEDRGPHGSTLFVGDVVFDVVYERLVQGSDVLGWFWNHNNVEQFWVVLRTVGYLGCLILAAKAAGTIA